MSAGGGIPARAAAFVLAVLTAMAPVLATVCYLSWFHQASLFDHIPLMSDSMDYWHEIKSFLAVGLDSGYYGYEELHAPLGRFGAHGPWYPILMGLVGRISGFPLTGIPVIHLGFLATCILVYMALARPRASQCLFLLTFTLTYPPMFFWGPFSMQESLHMALGIAMAGLTDLLVRRYRDGALTAAIRITFLCCVVFASLLRFTWVLLVIPLILASFKNTRKGWLLSLAQFAGIFLVLQYFGATLVQAPFPYFDTGIGKALHGDFEVLGKRITYNLHGLFLDLQKDPASWMFTMRYQILAFLSVPVLATLLARGAMSPQRGRSGRMLWLLELFPTFFLAASIAMVFAFYLTNDIFILKIIVPVFVFGVFYSVRFVPVRWLWALVLVNVLSLPSALGLSVQAHTGSFDRVGTTRALIDGFTQRVAPYLVHSPGAQPWCNTLVISSYQVEILGVPPGFGLNFVSDYQKFPGPLRSRFLLAPPGADLSGLSGKADLEELAITTAGTLYRNRLAECGGARPAQDSAP